MSENTLLKIICKDLNINEFEPDVNRVQATKQIRAKINTLQARSHHYSKTVKALKDIRDEFSYCGNQHLATADHDLISDIDEILSESEKYLTNEEKADGE